MNTSLALLGVLALRLRRIGDPAVRHALSALGVCVVTHLVTDNCYGTPVGSAWCGVAAGLVFAAPVAGTPTPLRSWLPPVAACLWPLALLAVWGAAHTIPSALLTSASPTVARISHVRQALEPQAVYQQAVFALSDSRPAPTLAEAHVIIDQAVAKVGWTGRLPNLAVRLAEAEGAALRQADMLLRVLRLRPFDRLSYLRLADLAGRNAEVAAMLSAEVRQRLAVITGQVAADADLAAGTPRDIEAATRCFVAMVGAIARKVDWQTLRAPMSGLVSRYGDIPGVAQFAVESICQAPEGTFVELLPQAAVLAWGLRFQGVGLVAAPLCMTPVEARRVLPLLTAIHPELIARCATGLPLAPQWISDEHLRVVRIWGLARLGSPTVP